MRKEISYSHKSIMWLIYLRTLLELAIEYDEKKKVIRHSLTTTAWQIYRQICNIERHIYNKSEQLRNKYIEAHDMSKPVWAKSLEKTGEKYQIYIEPILATLYSENEKEMTYIGLMPTLFMRLYDNYFLKYDCELEVESVSPVDTIVKETEKALFEFKKEKKRNK